MSCGFCTVEQQMQLDVKQLGSKQMPVDAISSSQLLSYGIALWTADASECRAANLQLSSQPGSDKLLGQVVNV